MTFTSGPWNGSDFAEDKWRRLFGQALGSKLLDIGNLTVSSSDRTISWSGAVGLINGALAVSDGLEVFDFPIPSGSNKRIDWLILRYDPAEPLFADKVKAEMLLGAEAINPSAPSLTQDPEGVWEMPIYRLGPWGSGTAASAPRDDYRVRRGQTRSGNDVQRLFSQGNEYGDIGFTPDNIYFHDNSTWNAYFGKETSQQYSSPDQGYPIAKEARSDNPIISNQLTVPAVPYRRNLMISAQHFLNVAAGSNNFDSALLLGASSNPVRRARHPFSTDHAETSTVTLSTTHTLAANASLRIRVAFIRATEFAHPNMAQSSGVWTHSNINVLATPTN